jgi:hypothetical protein
MQRNSDNNHKFKRFACGGEILPADWKRPAKVPFNGEKPGFSLKSKQKCFSFPDGKENIATSAFCNIIISSNVRSIRDTTGASEIALSI